MSMDDNLPIAAKATSYRVTAQDQHTVFTNRGAGGAVTFTLPPAISLNAGWSCEFYVVANQDVTVRAMESDPDTLVVVDDDAADNVAFSTSNEKVGGSLRVIWDGQAWLVQPFLWEGQTITAAS